MSEQQTTCSCPLPVCQDDEIRLIDLWRILTRRKVVVAGVFVATMLAAVAYLLLTPPIYESRVMVLVGQSGNPLEDLTVFGQRLLVEYPELDSVESVKGGAKNVFTLTLRHQDKLLAEQHLQKIVEQVLSDHQVAFDKLQQPKRRRLESLEKQQDDHRRRLNELNRQIERLQPKDSTLVMIFTLAKDNHLRWDQTFEQQIVSLRESLAEPNAIQTRLLGHQSTSNKPVEPKARTIMTLAAVLGMLLGIFVAFFYDIIKLFRI